MIKKKVCLLGAYGVGKTSLVRRFVESIFDERYQTTLGVRIERRDVMTDGRQITMILWDMAGEDNISRVPPAYLKGASGYIFVADGTRVQTLDVAVQLRETFGSDTDVPFLIALNKFDVKESWTITGTRIAELEGLGWQVHETSAKTGGGVEQIFSGIALQMLRNHDRSAGVS